MGDLLMDLVVMLLVIFFWGKMYVYLKRIFGENKYSFWKGENKMYMFLLYYFKYWYKINYSLLSIFVNIFNVF